MNKETLKELILKHDDEVELIGVKGSGKEPHKMDYWSDYDYLIVTSNKHLIDTYKTLFSETFKPIVGSQIYEYEGCLTYRVVYGDDFNQEDIQVVTKDFYVKYKEDLIKDIQFIYGNENMNVKETIVDSNHVYNLDQINDIWFRYYETVKKYSRCDNLIGNHLLLDLMRDYLVLEMVDRDIELKTNIHRHGNNEKFPEVDMTLLKSNAPWDKLELVLQLARLYDHKLYGIHEAYDSRFNVFSRHVEKSIEVLKGEN